MTKTKNERITILEKEVAELKLIVHELRGKKSIEPSTTNNVEDIIEFEGQKYRKVEREAHEGDVVIFSESDSDHIFTGIPYKVKKESADRLKVNGFNIYNSLVGRTPKVTTVYELIKPKPLTPNQQRFLTIINAKRYVAERQAVMLFGHVDFIVNTEKRTIVALLKPLGSNQVVKRGIAKCNPNDVFNEHIGKAISLGRALGLEVSEFEQAVQPTVAIGQLIESHSNVVYKVFSLENSMGNVKYKAKNGSWQNAEGGDLPNEIWYKIINDSNAIYKEGSN